MELFKMVERFNEEAIQEGKAYYLHMTVPMPSRIGSQTIKNEVRANVLITYSSHNSFSFLSTDTTLGRDVNISYEAVARGEVAIHEMRLLE